MLRSQSLTGEYSATQGRGARLLKAKLDVSYETSRLSIRNFAKQFVLTVGMECVESFKFSDRFTYIYCREAELCVKGCLYQRMFEAENAEHLLSACCCSQDKIW